MVLFLKRIFNCFELQMLFAIFGSFTFEESSLSSCQSISIYQSKEKSLMKYWIDRLCVIERLVNRVRKWWEISVTQDNVYSSC